MTKFLTRLTTLLSTTHNKNHGSVFLTQKPLPSLETPQILIRATNGKSKEHRKKGEKEKMSTIVDVKDLGAFYTKYTDVCKKGFTELRKRDKKKAKAKKKKGAAKATS